MAYSTIDDILKLMDTEVVAGMTSETENYDDELVEQSITDADSEINSYLQARYDVPITPVPAVIKKISVDIAIYNLYSRRRSPPEHRIKRYDDAISFLKDVSRGSASLGVEDLETDAVVDSGVQTDAQQRIFTRTTMREF